MKFKTSSVARNLSYSSKELKKLVETEIAPIITDACSKGLVMARYKPSANLTTEQIITICSYLSYNGYSVESNVTNDNSFIISWGN